MPSAFVHATIDFIAFGWPFFDRHQQKDAPWKDLGAEHRSLHHEWYNAFELDWDLNNPFPQELNSVIDGIANKHGDAEAEACMAVHVAHDYFDRRWDSLEESERRYITGLCVWLLFNPDVLRDTFGCDVVNGTIQRTIEGKQIREHAPGLSKEYKRLRRYARAIVERG